MNKTRGQLMQFKDVMVGETFYTTAYSSNEPRLKVSASKWKLYYKPAGDNNDVEFGMVPNEPVIVYRVSMQQILDHPIDE